MDKLLTSVLAIFLLIPVHAQEKVRELVSDSYDRNSLTVIIAEHGDGYDQNVKSVFNSKNLGDKFDINEIPTKYMKVPYSRDAGAYLSDASRNAINSMVNNSDLGKEIVSYWYNRKPNGMMDAERVLFRGRYNATDLEYLKAAATKTGTVALGDGGFRLISNSYILVVDYRNIKSKTEDDKVTWSATAEGYLYRLAFDQIKQAELNECWIYDDDPDEERTRKNELFKKLRIEMVPVASAYSTKSVTEKNGGLRTAIHDSYEDLIVKLENQVDSWNVRSSISGLRPVRSKIGTKEGLKNGKRFFAYEHRADNNGKVYSVKKGTVRATKIANNRNVSVGESPSSEFYQIAGGKLQEGMVLRQKNDLGLGISAGYRVGALSGVNINLDWLTHITTAGHSQYVMIDMTVNGHGARKYFRQHDLDLSGVPDVVTPLDFQIGYGYGIRPIRHFEIVPNIKFGFEYLISENDLKSSDNGNGNTDDDDDKFREKLAWIGSAGIKFNVNIKYPLQLVVGADYHFRFGDGEIYKQNIGYLKEMGKDRNGFGAFAAIKYTF